MEFNFNIDSVIDEEYVLSRISEESIFCYYMDLPKITKKLVRSIVRNDSKPTCGFFRKNYLYLKDFATGDCYNCFGLVMRIYGCSYYSALNKIADDFGLTNNSTLLNKVSIIPKYRKTERCKIQIEKQDYTEQQLDWWKQFGITLPILKKYNVYSCKYVFLNNAINAQSTDKCPIYGYYMGKDTVELWRIYFPNRTSFRFLSNTPASLIQGFKQLPEKGNLLVITKSMKDVMTFYSLGIPAIAPNSEHLFINENVLDDLKMRFKHIVVMYDNDLAGINGMSKIKKIHPELIYSWIPRHLGSKDISDLYKALGYNKVKNLIKKYLKIVFKI